MANNIDNPYFSLAEQLKKQGENNMQSVIIGKIVSVSPLLINGNNMQLDQGDILISKSLLNYEFRTGMDVLLLTADNQQFILICEVV